MDRTLLIVLTIVLVLLNGLFVAAEFALVKVRKRRLERMVDERRLFAAHALWLWERLDNALSACQIGITMASLGLGWVGEPAVARLLEPVFEAVGITSVAVVHTISFVIAFSIITAAHLLIGEQVPKILAIRRPELLAVWCAVPTRFFYILFYPMLVALSASTSMLLKLFGVTGGAGHDQVHSEEELRSLVSDAHVHGGLTQAKHRLIDAAFAFDETVARQIMLPRVDVAFFDVEDSLAAALATAKATLHTRYPLCEGSLDNVIGVVHVKDLVGVGGDVDLDLRTIMRPPRFVPETLPISRLLGQFQAIRQHLMFVVDEYGTMSGIVTLENVLERIVGAVQDEFDAETPDIVPDGPGRSLVNGGLTLAELRGAIDVNWRADDVDTVSGFVTKQLGRVPVVGDRVEMADATVEVTAVDHARATTVRIIIAEDADESTSS